MGVTADVINLRGGLVVPGTPGCSAVDGDQRALIADQENNVGIVGIDPEILIVVAAGSAAKAEPGFAAVGGLHGHSACAIDHVRIFRIDSRDGEIAAADAAGGARIVRGLGPSFAGVVGAVESECAGCRADCGVKTMRIAGRDGDVDLGKIFRQAIG